MVDFKGKTAIVDRFNLADALKAAGKPRDSIDAIFGDGTMAKRVAVVGRSADGSEFEVEGGHMVPREAFTSESLRQAGIH